MFGETAEQTSKAERIAKAKTGFCPLPWIHLSANTDTSMRVCCNTDHGGHVKNERGEIVYLSDLKSAREAMNQETHKKLRLAMLAGERPDFCKRCYVEEDHGAVSIRQIYLRHFSSVLDSAVSEAMASDKSGEIDPRITYVDFSLSNNCNLKCRMCSPHSSYPLLNEFKELGLHYSPDQAEKANRGWNFDENLGRIAAEVVPYLTEMLTTGGEPFLSQQHYKILEMCVASGRSHEVVLRYHSNLTILPERLLKIWRLFRKVEIHVSLEGVGEVNEYVRYPAKWSQIQTNLRILQSLRSEIKMHVEIHTCLQAISWLRLGELLHWVAKTSIELEGLFPRIPYPIWIDQPSEMTLLALPPKFREMGAKRILQELDWIEPMFEDRRSPDFEFGSAKSFRAAISRLLAAPFDENDFRLFWERTKGVDRFRGQSLAAVIPELTEP